MFLNLRNSIPPWKDDLLLADKADAWKWQPGLDAAKALYEQWAEVYSIVALFADTLTDKRKKNDHAAQEEEDSDSAFTKRMIYENLMVVAPKIRSAAGDTLYIIKMENAAVIRFNCMKLMEMVGWAALNGEADPKYKGLIGEAMATFRQRFKAWVDTFQKDAIDDEWGLFV